MKDTTLPAPPKKNLALILGFVLVCLVALSFLFFSLFNTTGGDFSLNYRGHKWTYSQEARKVNLLYMGYANCPDVCPLSLSVMAQAFKKLTVDESDHIRQIFISVDYPHDTPESVADYAAHFNPNFIGLTGAGQEG